MFNLKEARSAPIARTRDQIPSTPSLEQSQSHSILGLQRLVGNQKTQQLLKNQGFQSIQRSLDDDADDFIKWMQKEKDYLKYSSLSGKEASEMCDTAAGVIIGLLNQKKIPFHVRTLLNWDSLEALGSMSHFVVIATVNGEQIVIDPTQAQFSGGKAMVVRLGSWENALKSIWANFYSKYSEFDNLTSATKYADKAMNGGRRFSEDSGTIFTQKAQDKKKDCLIM